MRRGLHPRRAVRHGRDSAHRQRFNPRLDLTGTVEVAADNGRIALTSLAGNVVGHSDNGNISAMGMTAANITLWTDNGDVRVELARTPDSIRVRTNNGDVDVRVPQPDEYNVIAATHNGSKAVDVTLDPTSDRVIDVATDNGDISVRYRTD